MPYDPNENSFSQYGFLNLSVDTTGDSNDS